MYGYPRSRRARLHGNLASYATVQKWLASDRGLCCPTAEPEHKLSVPGYWTTSASIRNKLIAVSSDLMEGGKAARNGYLSSSRSGWWVGHPEGEKTRRENLIAASSSPTRSR